MNSANKNICPEIYQIEAFVTHRLSSISDRKSISTHIDNCEHCKALAAELREFYDILERENDKPASHNIFKLIDAVENGHVAITGILLQPLEKLNGHLSLQFHSQVILTTEHDKSANLDKLNYIPLDTDEILLRAIQSRATLETTIFLFAHKKKLYRNIQLQISSSGKKFVSDGIGKIEMGQFDINNLNNQLITITFEKK